MVPKKIKKIISRITSDRKKLNLKYSCFFKYGHYYILKIKQAFKYEYVKKRLLRRIHMFLKKFQNSFFDFLFEIDKKGPVIMTSLMSKKRYFRKKPPFLLFS